MSSAANISRDAEHSPSSARRADSEVLAAVDLGSNSFHMKVARYEAGQLVVVDRLREMVRLAAGLEKSGRISKEAQERALACLARYGQRIRDMRADTVRVVATNTFRKAIKAEKFKRRAEKVLGHPIEVVSGREEARLVYSGVAHSSPMLADKMLVLDIGGGSTELIVGERFTPRQLFSLQMGCVSITRKFFADGRITGKRVKKARIAASVELEPVVAPISGWSWQEAVGASGTVRAVAAILAAADSQNVGITPEGLQWLIRELISFGRIANLDMPGLDPARAPVFVGGVIILETVFKALAIEHMRVSDGALREGILFDLVGRISHEDARERSVRFLQERYSVDVDQANLVEHTALQLLADTADKWRLTGVACEALLRWAARTHEVGLAIAHSGYHRHGAYLLANSDLPGFSTYEQRRLAVLVGLHRKRFDVSSLSKIESDWRDKLHKLAVLLRLSVVLHRGRGPGEIPAILLKVRRDGIRLEFPDAWLDEHPLTLADLLTEQNYLAEGGFQLKVL